MSDSKSDKPKKSKGLNKQQPDSNDPNKNPLLKVENKSNFKIVTGNLLQEPSMLIFDGFKKFDIQKDKDHFEISKINSNSTIIVVLRYYEYICYTMFDFNYIVPILESGLTAKDVFEMVKHSLKNKLLINAPTFDTIIEFEIFYQGYIRY